ncbi:15824_t:CDS:1, partial [Racocetra persica]
IGGFSSPGSLGGGSSSTKSAYPDEKKSSTKDTPVSSSKPAAKPSTKSTEPSSLSEIIDEVKNKNSNGEDWSPEEKETIEKILTENMATDNNNDKEEEKSSKITNMEQIKLVQEFLTKAKQAQKIKSYSKEAKELYNWLNEQKTEHHQIYLM